MAQEKIISEIMARAESEEGRRIAEEAVSRLQGADPGDRMFELKERDIMRVLKVSYIAERFFGRSRSWLCHKLNHDMKNGKPDGFTDAERRRLKDALEAIAQEIQALSDDM